MHHVTDTCAEAEEGAYRGRRARGEEKEREGEGKGERRVRKGRRERMIE